MSHGAKNKNYMHFFILLACAFQQSSGDKPKWTDLIQVLLNYLKFLLSLLMLMQH